VLRSSEANYNEAAANFKMLFDQSFAVFGVNSFGVGVALQCFGLLEYPCKMRPNTPALATFAPFSALQQF
jgi:hypothetical protein